MTAYRYWRVRAPDGSSDPSGSGFGYGLSEMKFYNLSLVQITAATGSKVIFSSEYTSLTFAHAQLVDGSTASGNGWYGSVSKPGSVNGWVGYDFSSAIDVGQITIAPLNGFPLTFPAHVHVEGSNDLSSWFDYGDFALAAASDNVFQTLNIIPPVESAEVTQLSMMILYGEASFAEVSQLALQVLGRHYKRRIVQQVAG